MANSSFNFSAGTSTEEFLVNNVEMNCVEEFEIQSVKDNPHVARSTAPIASLLHLASSNGGNNFNVFISSTASNTLPKRDPRSTQAELQRQATNADKIDNVRYTRSGSIIVSTKDVMCATSICNISEFLGVTTSTRVIWENITNRFLLFNMPVSISLAEIAKELSSSNNINILELRRFIRRDSNPELSPILVTTLGTSLPLEIKIWLTIHQIRQFIDRPRQCLKCFKFNHVTSKCNSSQLCTTCGTHHEGPCSLKLSCTNCSGEHRSDYNQCPFRLKEAEFLNFKCKHFLSFVAARRAFFKKADKTSYAQVTRTQQPDSDAVQKCIETRTNMMLKIILESLSKQSDSLNETIAALSSLIVKFLDKLNNDPPDKRKKASKGLNSQHD